MEIPFSNKTELHGISSCMHNIGTSKGHFIASFISILVDVVLPEDQNDLNWQQQDNNDGQIFVDYDSKKFALINNKNINKKKFLFSTFEEYLKEYGEEGENKKDLKAFNIRLKKLLNQGWTVGNAEDFDGFVN